MTIGSAHDRLVLYLNYARHQSIQCLAHDDTRVFPILIETTQNACFQAVLQRHREYKVEDRTDAGLKTVASERRPLDHPTTYS